MFEVPAALNLDGYKTSHRVQYSPKTEKVYSTWTPRKSRIDGVDKVVFFGLQYFIKDYLIDSFNKTFFNRPKEEVMNEIKRTMKYYNGNEDVSCFEKLHDLGYLPLKIHALPEGTLTPIRVPMFTIENTLPEFYWLTNFVETILSTEIWKPMTSATIALQYRKIMEKWSEKTCDNNDWIDFAGHDFSYRGMAGTDAGASSGAGHLLSFKGTDTIPAVLWLEKYYQANAEKELVGCSIPATEHAVAETNIIEIQDMLDKGEFPDPNNILGTAQFGEDVDTRLLAEVFYLDRLLNVYPSGLFSYVSDTYNLWEVCSTVLPTLKDKIMERDGKVVIRPDSGDPCDIICGLNSNENYKYEDDILYKKQGKDVVSEGPCSWLEDTYSEVAGDYIQQKAKGVVELLWDTFGGTINSKGYKVLDSHIGCIYGDAITMERCDEICRRLESKGFAAENVVFGIGSYTYNMNTRDTFGFALKATYGIVDGKQLLLYKDPITDDGTKKSQKGRVVVVEENGQLQYIDELYMKSWIALHTTQDKMIDVFEDGKLLKDYTLQEIRDLVKSEMNKKEVVTV